MRWLGRAEELVANLAYLLMTLMILGEIVAREFFSATLLGSTKIAILSSAVAGFVGFALVTRGARHLRMSAFDGIIPQGWRAAHARAADLISTLIYLGLAYFAALYVGESIAFQDRVEVLLIPRWPFQCVMVYAFLSSALWHLTYFLYPSEKPLAEIAASSEENS